MKTMLLVATLTTLFTVGSIQILKETTPRPGKGALTTFRKDLKLHQYFEMDSSAQAYIDLIKCMGLMDKDGKSELVKPTDKFCIAKNDSGYFPAILRKEELLKHLTIVYLKPREEYLKNDDPEKFLSEVNRKKEITKEDAIMEQEYPLKDFPKTLRIGAGKGEFAKDAYYVKTLQDALTDQGYQVPADGVFDKEIENSVIDFQKKRHLNPDGIVGEKTQQALNIGKFREKSWYENPLFDPFREQIDAFFAEN